MIVGSIWYGPLFGKMYMTAVGMDQWSAEKKADMKKKMGWSYFGQFIASLVMFYVLGTFIAFSAPIPNVSYAMGISFFMWIGFVVPMAFGVTLWGGKSTTFWLTIGNMLITLLVAGAIFGAWH
jgi:hypothetical protein